MYAPMKTTKLMHLKKIPSDQAKCSIYIYAHPLFFCFFMNKSIQFFFFFAYFQLQLLSTFLKNSSHKLQHELFYFTYLI